MMRSKKKSFKIIRMILKKYTTIEVEKYVQDENSIPANSLCMYIDKEYKFKDEKYFGEIKKSWIKENGLELADHEGVKGEACQVKNTSLAYLLCDANVKELHKHKKNRKEW